MQVKELGHAVLYVRDLERSRHFYGDILGFERDRRRPARVPAAAFNSASGRTHHELLLIEVGPDGGAHPRPVAASGLYHLGLKVGETDDELRDGTRASSQAARRDRRRRVRPHGHPLALHPGSRRQRARALHRRAARAVARRPVGGARPGQGPPDLTGASTCSTLSPPAVSTRARSRARGS